MFRFRICGTVWISKNGAFRCPGLWPAGCNFWRIVGEMQKIVCQQMQFSSDVDSVTSILGSNENIQISSSIGLSINLRVVSFFHHTFQPNVMFPFNLAARHCNLSGQMRSNFHGNMKCHESKVPSCNTPCGF